MVERISVIFPSLWFTFRLHRLNGCLLKPRKIDRRGTLLQTPPLHASIPSTFNNCSARATPRLSLKLFGETDAVVPLPTEFYRIAMQLWRWILKLCTARESSVA